MLIVLLDLLVVLLLTSGKCVSTTSEGIYTKEGNIEYVVQHPSGVIKGLIFLAHGCSHSSTDWFPKGRQCQGCIGLPIERYIVSKVLAEGYVALSMSSIDRIRKCWVPRIDTEAAVKTIRKVRNHLNVPPSAPNYLIGASSGGFFVSTLGIYLNKVAKEEGDPSLACQGISIQVASIHPRLCRDRSMIKFLPSSVFFVHMKRDEHITRAVEEAIACINDDESNEKKKADEHVHASAVLAKPLTLHPSYFSNLSSHLTPEDSERYVHGLERAGFVDPNSHELKLDPRSQVDAFVKVARETIIDISTKDSLVPDESGILELLNAAYAYHEITAEGLDEILAAWRKLQNQNP